jgi:lyso-ornithine lipid O-acyltransferase
VALALALSLNIAHYWLLRHRAPLTLEHRARWLQAACRRVMAAMGIRCHIDGAVPERGVAVSNHLSYLDILIYGAMMPCFFVSKAEVSAWPYFGRAARTGGAIFLDRTKRSAAVLAVQEIGERLKLAVPVLIFPEGTSTDGTEVLRFHTGLFEPAMAAGAPVTAAAIRYTIEGGVPERELCWFGDALFLPHLWKALGTRGFRAEVRFGEPRVYADRRAAAQATWEEVVSMRSLGKAHADSRSIPMPARRN